MNRREATRHTERFLVMGTYNSLVAEVRSALLRALNGARSDREAVSRQIKLLLLNTLHACTSSWRRVLFNPGGAGQSKDLPNKLTPLPHSWHTNAINRENPGARRATCREECWSITAMCAWQQNALLSTSWKVV